MMLSHVALPPVDPGGVSACSCCWGTMACAVLCCAVMHACRRELHATLLVQDTARVKCMVLCHFVSLVPIRQPRLADVPLWATSKDFLEVSCGPPWQHAHLLAGFLLHEGVDCYVVCGAGRHGALHLSLFSSPRSRLQRLHAATDALLHAGRTRALAPATERSLRGGATAPC